jgi:hypothetical protein
MEPFAKHRVARSSQPVDFRLPPDETIPVAADEDASVPAGAIADVERFAREIREGRTDLETNAHSLGSGG